VARSAGALSFGVLSLGEGMSLTLGAGDLVSTESVRGTLLSMAMSLSSPVISLRLGSASPLSELLE
jgi:hypothetical protein